MNIFGEYATEELDQWLTKAENNKPTDKVLFIYGPPGSGKTELLNRLINEFSPHSLSTHGYIEFIDPIMRFVGLDNVDRNVDRVMNPLVMASLQHGSITRRKLYADNEMITITPRAAIAITSCYKPTWDTILDCCLLLETKRHA